jgi:hypothetical protein
MVSSAAGPPTFGQPAYPKRCSISTGEASGECVVSGAPKAATSTISPASI